MEGLLIKNNNLFGEVRFMEMEGKIYAVANDIARALGYAKPNNAINAHCKGATLKQGIITDRLGRIQDALIIPEGDIYRLIVRSKLPQAEQFERWIFDEVIPQIRQTGGYVPVAEDDDDEALLAKALLIAQKTIDKKNKLLEEKNKQLEEQKPLVQFANTIANSNSCIDIGKFAKLITDEGIKMGRNNLFKWLRNNKYLMSGNEPYQKYIDNGYFEIKEYIVNTNHGELTKITPLITGKGQIKIIEKLRNERGL